MAAGSHSDHHFPRLETMSISIYIPGRDHQGRSEIFGSGSQIFYFGRFCHGVSPLWKMAFIYGATGSLYLKEVASYIASKNLLRNPMLLMSLVFLTIGFGFKIASAPFQYVDARCL